MIRYEIKKIFSKTGGKVGLLILTLALAVICYFAVTSIEYIDENGDAQVGVTAAKTLREMKEKWEGYVTEERLQEVIRENNRISREYPEDPNDIVGSNIVYAKTQGYQDIEYMINHAFSPFRDFNPYRIKSVSEAEVGNLYQRRITSLKEWLDDGAKDSYSEKEKAFLIGKYEKLETPFYYAPADGWQAALEYAPTIIMLTVLITGFFVSGIFSNEFQWKADSIYFSTKNGRTVGTCTKMKAGFLVITGIYWVTMMVYSMVVLGILGAGGADCSIQSGFSFWRSIYSICYWQAYLLTMLGGYVGALFILFLSMLISAKTHTAVVAVTIPFIIIFVDPFLGGIAELADFLGLFPDKLLQLNMALSSLTLYEIGGKVIGSVPILLGTYLVLSVLFLPLMYRVYRRTEIK